MNLTLYYLSVWYMCVAPFYVGMYIVQWRVNTITDWCKFLIYLHLIILFDMVVEFEALTVRSKRNLYPQLITFPKEFRWFKLWLIDLFLLQVLLGYYSFFLRGEETIYSLLISTSLLLIIMTGVYISYFRKKVIAFVEEVYEKDRV